MKRSLIIIVAICLTLIAFGCRSNDTSPTNYGSRILKDDERINYTVDQILLSQSFQSTEPSIEVTSKKNTIKVVASLGLTESSGVKINKLVKRGNEVDIHVSGIYDESKLKLAVPHLTLEITTPRFSKNEDLKFNIVKDDYRPLKIKFGVNETLSKIQSHFKISPTGAPIINLTRLKDDIIWDITYESIFDRENPQNPLINLSASIDANSGDILDFEKTFISSTIDDGHILDYISDNYILYKKPVKSISSEDSEEQLWSYNLLTQEKNMLFSSNFKIHSAKYSDNLSYISIIESSDKGTGLYIIPRSDQKTYKVSFEDIFNPKIMTWKDDNNLYLIEKTNKESIVFSYHVDKNTSNRVAKVNKDIESLIIRDNWFLILEKGEDNFNKIISTTLDWEIFDFIDYGYNPGFIGGSKLGFLQKDEKLHTNSLILYNIKDQENINIIGDNITTFQILSDDLISYVNNNPNYNNFTLVKYSLKDESKEDLASLVEDRVFYDPKRNSIYANITLPFESDKQEIIYSIDLTKLN